LSAPVCSASAVIRLKMDTSAACTSRIMTAELALLPGAGGRIAAAALRGGVNFSRRRFTDFYLR